MRFLRIRLENWRNFLEADVTLGKRAFLVGPNASGKSNFLDSFRFLRDVAEPQGGFQRAVAERGSVSQIRSLHARRYSVSTTRPGSNPTATAAIPPPRPEPPADKNSPYGIPSRHTHAATNQTETPAAQPSGAVAKADKAEKAQKSEKAKSAQTQKAAATN